MFDDKSQIAHLSREQLEQVAAVLFKARVGDAVKERQTVQEDENDKATEDKLWAYAFAGNPHAFFTELIPDWQNANWTAWRAFVSAVFVVPFASEAEAQIFRDCTDLETPPARPSRVWMPVGRRGGKSRILAAIAVYLAVCYDWSHYLVPGETGVLPVLAADRRQARVIMGYVKAFLEHKRLKGRIEHDQTESVLLEGNILIEVVTASYRAVRSRTVIAALCDEIAFWHSDEDSANPDKDIVAALEPAMATIPNALLLGASSPYARRGVLWDNFNKYFGKEEDSHLIWRAPTKVMNPTVSQDFLDEKYAEDAIAAAAEYGAQFRTDVDAFITQEVIDGIKVPGVQELLPVQGVKYFAFVDPSGGSSDSMTLAVGHIDPETRHGVLDCLRERRPPFSPESVVVEFAALLKTYRIAKVTGDHYAGEWPRERFRLKGIEYTVSDVNKSNIYLGFLPIANAGRCTILDNLRLQGQLLGLDRRISRGGHESIDHAPGAHDDLANVCAGVMHKMLSKKQTLTIDPNVLRMSQAIVMKRPVDLINLTPRW